MNAIQPLLSSAAAAARLDISAKTLRIYEQHGLITPLRNAAGWRFYGAEQMDRAQQIVTLRRLGLNLAQVGRALAGETTDLDAALAEHQANLDRQISELVAAVETTRTLRIGIAEGKIEPDLLRAVAGPKRPVLELSLPWPWAGELFVLPRLAPVTYLVGSLGSGKTRLAQAIAGEIPGGRFVGLDRADGDAQAARAILVNDPTVNTSVQALIEWLVADGAKASPVLLALAVALVEPGEGPLVFDLIEDGLDEASQEALAGWLGRRTGADRPLVVMTRSSGILDLAAVERDRIIVFCPANHSPPQLVLPFVGSTGYEALASCLGTPEMRERTIGMMAVMPQPARSNSPG
ncbi:MAG TPA: MerR family transcriptional regulator [Devosia sp.]|nr:MerR family transcriptional regulator [Devosia sp.]